MTSPSLSPGSGPLALALVTRALRRLPAALGFALLLGVCALFGMVIALGSPQLDLILLAVICGPLLLFVPARWILPLLIVLAFVVVGLAMYYLRLSKLFWVPYMLCVFLILKLPLDALGQRARIERQPPMPIFVWLLFAFFAAVMTSSLMNGTPLINMLVGGKHFLFVWAVMFLVASRSIDDAFLRNCWMLLLWIAIAQFPFAIVQRVFSHGNWDAIVGTFGGDPKGGGGSGMMAIFLAIIIGVAIALLKARQIKPAFGMTVIVCALGSVALGEVKVFFGLLPIVIAVVLRRDFLRRPAFAVGMLAATLITVVGIATLYEAHFSSVVSSHRKIETQDYLDYVFRDESNLDFVNYRSGEVSRLGAPLIWLRTATHDGTDKFLFGYGLTASRPSETIGKGVMAKRFPFTLNTSTVTILLWDSGLIGFALFCAMLVAAGARAQHLSSNETIAPFHRACLDGCVAAFVALFITLPYNGVVIDHVSQIFLPFVAGYVLYWARRTAVD